MSRNYSQEFLIQLFKDASGSLGVALARACVRANLPAKYVAVVLNTTRMTIHGWFRGKPIRAKKIETVKAFMRLLEKDTEAGRLPAKNVADAKVYLGEMIGQEIK